MVAIIPDIKGYTQTASGGIVSLGLLGDCVR